MTALPDFDTIAETFSLLDDWDDRYAYLIDLGKALPAYPDAAKTDAHQVEGCTSQVWMVTSRDKDGRLSILAESDALIVRGLIGVLMAIYHGTTAEEARVIDIQDRFAMLGLSSHLSPNRRNGFFAMVERVRVA